MLTTFTSYFPMETTLSSVIWRFKSDEFQLISSFRVYDFLLKIFSRRLWLFSRASDTKFLTFKKKLFLKEEQMFIVFLKKAQKLRELGAIAEEPGLVPRMHMITKPRTPVSRDLIHSSGLLDHHAHDIYICRQGHSYP